MVDRTKKGKICFIKPSSTSRYHPTKQYALGILYLSSILQSKGYETEAYDHVNLDLDKSLESFRKTIRDSKPSIVGINCDSHNRYSCFKIAEMIKNIDKNISIIVGGLHSSYYWKQILNKIPEIDYILLGESEITIVDLIKGIQEKKDITSIKGIAYRKRKDGTPILSGRQAPLNNLDHLPYPKHVEYKDMIEDIKEASINSSRGCPARCNFCSPMTFWGGFRSRSAKNVFHEMKMLKKRFSKINRIYFQEQCFTYDRDRVMDLCRLLQKNNLGLSWGFETRVDCIDKKLASELRKSGCDMICYGIESGSNRILKSLNKGFDRKQSEKAIRISCEAGIDVHVYLILGSPTEDRASIIETLKFLWKNSRWIEAIQVGPFYIYPWSGSYMKEFRYTEEYWMNKTPIPINTAEYSKRTLYLGSWLLRAYFIAIKGPFYFIKRIFQFFKKGKMLEWH